MNEHTIKRMPPNHTFFEFFKSKQRIGKTLLLSLFMICLPLSLSAQIGEPRNGLSLGINVGVSLNTISFSPTVNQNFHIGPTFGATLRYTSEKYFKTICSLQMEINYNSLGWTENINNSKNQKLPDTYSRDLHYLQVPLLTRLGWGRERRGAMFYVLAGPQVGYCFKETSRRSSVWTLNSDGVPDRPNEMYKQYDMPVKRKFD